jgi:hypothetical protein
VSFKNTWIGDSGSSCNYFNSDEGLFDQGTISEMITIGNGRKMKAEKAGKISSFILQCYERKFEIILENVKLVPDLWINLFRINKALMNGFII